MVFALLICPNSLHHKDLRRAGRGALVLSACSIRTYAYIIGMVCGVRTPIGITTLVSVYQTHNTMRI